MTAIGGFKILQMLMQGVTDRDPPVLPVGWSMVPCGSFDGLELSTAVTKLWSKIKIACYTFEGVFISASTMFLALLAYSRMQAGDGAAVVCYGLPDLYTPPEVGEIYKKLKAVWHREPEAFGKVAAKDPSKVCDPVGRLRRVCVTLTGGSAVCVMCRVAHLRSSCLQKPRPRHASPSRETVMPAVESWSRATRRPKQASLKRVVPSSVRSGSIPSARRRMPCAPVLLLISRSRVAPCTMSWAAST